MGAPTCQDVGHGIKQRYSFVFVIQKPLHVSAGLFGLHSPDFPSAVRRDVRGYFFAVQAVQSRHPAQILVNGGPCPVFFGVKPPLKHKKRPARSNICSRSRFGRYTRRCFPVFCSETVKRPALHCSRVIAKTSPIRSPVAMLTRNASAFAGIIAPSNRSITSCGTHSARTFTPPFNFP